MKFISNRLLFWVILFLTMYGCANQGAPSGGPRDPIPPELVKSEPENETLFFEDDVVTFTFDEFIKPVTYGKEIFISPFQVNRPKVTVVNKRLKIKFLDQMRDSSTYVIILNDITDYYGGNKIAGSISLAFSTGGVLDSMKVRGKVESPLAGVGEKDITLLLFPIDSILDNNFYKKQPSYIAKTDESGKFELPFLKKQPYFIYGINDIDQSNSYSQLTEMLALADTPRIEFEDSLSSVDITLYSFLPDNSPPLVSKYEWVDSNALLLSFSESLLTDSIDFAISDTSGGSIQKIEEVKYIQKPEVKYLLSVPRGNSVFSQLTITSLSDSLGNSSDTTLVLRPGSIKKTADAPLFKKPEPDIEKGKLLFMLPYLAPELDTSQVAILDTGKNKLSIEIERDGFEVLVKPMDSLNTRLTYILALSGELFDEQDSTFSFPFRWPDRSKYGSLQGSLTIPDYEGHVVMILEKGNGGTQYINYSREYNYDLMESGDYSIRVILDADSNRCWTPGSILPYKLPEKIISSAEKLNIRENWSLEEHEILISVKQNAGNELPADSTIRPIRERERPPGGRPGNRK